MVQSLIPMQNLRHIEQGKLRNSARGITAVRPDAHGELSPTAPLSCMLSHNPYSCTRSQSG
eukprot:10479992-Heterocapsa_arctica.AAC.1